MTARPIITLQTASELRHTLGWQGTLGEMETDHYIPVRYFSLQDIEAHKVNAQLVIVSDDFGLLSYQSESGGKTENFYAEGSVLEARLEELAAMEPHEIYNLFRSRAKRGEF